MKEKKKNKMGLIAKRPGYSISIKYSPKSERDGLIKFTQKGGKSFEIATADLINVLAKHVNTEVLAPAMMQNNVINMIRVTRNLSFTPNRDIAAGELVHIPFQHMMPIDFAIAEEALGVAFIDAKAKEVNKKELIKAKHRIDDKVRQFAQEVNEALIRKSQDQSTS